MSNFPNTRLRRNRTDKWLRNLLSENSVTVNDLILPLFVKDSKGTEAIKSMPDVYRYSIPELVKVVKQAKSLGINAIALFPYVDQKLKSTNAKESYNKNNLICRAMREIKNAVPDIGLICDVALDPYTSHGHDGLLNKKGEVDNDQTLEILVRQSICQSQAGADIIAPSDMMDGRIGKIRAALDQNGFLNTKILSYAAKYASNLYSPFREAVGSINNLGKADKATYQMNPANSKEALREVELDINEGADIVMIKPGIFYLDIITRVKDKFNVPVFAYQVSGEYAMIKLAGKNNILDYEKVILESIISFKRAGADAIFTYGAIDIAEILNS
jgi:porphobilinogen synthase